MRVGYFDSGARIGSLLDLLEEELWRLELSVQEQDSVKPLLRWNTIRQRTERASKLKEGPSPNYKRVLTFQIVVCVTNGVPTVESHYPRLQAGLETIHGIV